MEKEWGMGDRGWEIGDGGWGEVRSQEVEVKEDE
jgi:hypothetical protein